MSGGAHDLVQVIYGGVLADRAACGELGRRGISVSIRTAPSLFGRENLHIVVFEELMVDREGLLRRLLELPDADLKEAATTEKRAVGLRDEAVPVIRLDNVL
ncbi:MAG: hypothetical protein ACR2GF_06325 [Acidimicrobiales bacterium]